MENLDFIAAKPQDFQALEVFQPRNLLDFVETHVQRPQIYQVFQAFQTGNLVFVEPKFIELVQTVEKLREIIRKNAKIQGKPRFS